MPIELFDAASDGDYEKVKQLLKSKKPLNEHEYCLLCSDRTPDVVLIPCGHQTLCNACAHKWEEKKQGCPLDRLPISQIIPLER